MSHHRTSVNLEMQDALRAQEEAGAASVVSPTFISPSFLSPQHRLMTEPTAGLNGPVDLSGLFTRQLSGLGDEEVFLNETTHFTDDQGENDMTGVEVANDDEDENDPNGLSSLPIYPIDHLIQCRSGPMMYRTHSQGSRATETSPSIASPRPHIACLIDYTRPASSVSTPTRNSSLQEDGVILRPASTSGIGGTPLFSSSLASGTLTPRASRGLQQPRSATPSGRGKLRYPHISGEVPMLALSEYRDYCLRSGKIPSDGSRPIQQTQEVSACATSRAPGFRSPRSFFHFSSPPRRSQSGRSDTSVDGCLDSWGIWEDPSLVGGARLLASPDYLRTSKRPRHDL
ncbi:hypothetical protein BJ684DRAFT_21194 [Piptocephalis cylindrospora]|uniref:Uncharacterized protein n=1 Tax=Piptocephalis cylindrospora TaxID=1907219 RepID=A0A4P9Y0H4_9FUNG|nr:hypothetical protein BJ684DRAFT_21194 [Piptocephalis cylindrospora]|eukprot:RKP12253.1 hypothetical protein BJ684DRAFT_21194 [Piptocephalis cylindrospora]